MAWRFIGNLVVKKEYIPADAANPTTVIVECRPTQFQGTFPKAATKIYSEICLCDEGELSPTSLATTWISTSGSSADKDSACINRVKALYKVE